MVGCALALLLAGAAAPDSPAGPPLPAEASGLPGGWRIGHDGEGARTCDIRLRSSAVIGGYRLTLAKRCTKAVDRASELYSWRPAPGGKIALADATRQTVYLFHPLVGPVWASEGPEDTRYLMIRKPR